MAETKNVKREIPGYSEDCHGAGLFLGCLFLFPDLYILVLNSFKNTEGEFLPMSSDSQCGYLYSG